MADPHDYAAEAATVLQALTMVRGPDEYAEDVLANYLRAADARGEERGRQAVSGAQIAIAQLHAHWGAWRGAGGGR